MGQPAACIVCRGGIDGGIADIDERDLAFLVHDVGDSVSHAVGTQNAVRLERGAGAEIAQQGESQLLLVGEDFERGDVVGADAEDLGVIAFKFCDTSLVR